MSLDVIDWLWVVNSASRPTRTGTDNIVYVETKKPLTINVAAPSCGLGQATRSTSRPGSSAVGLWKLDHEQKALYGPIMKYLPPYSTTNEPEPQLRAA